MFGFLYRQGKGPCFHSMQQEKRGEASHGQAFEAHARKLAKGYNGGPKNMPHRRVHRESGKVVTFMLICSIRSIDYVVCQDCGNIFRLHSTGKHSCLCGTNSTVDYDGIIPEFVNAEGKEGVA